MGDEASRADTVERLLEAAEAEFAAHGFADARLEDIAAAVGVRRASLLYHFATKQALYDRVLERAFADLRAIFVATLGRPATSYAERFDEVIGRSVDNFTRRPLFARLLLRDTLDHEGFAAERARRFVAPLLELGDAFIRTGQAAGEFRPDFEPRPVLMFFVGSILFHAATCDAQRDVLWGPGRASGRGVRAWREQVRAMVRLLVLNPAFPRSRRAVAATPAPRRPNRRAALS